MEKFNRAERRSQTERLKAKRKLYWGRQYDGSMDARQLGKVVQYPQVCSCWMCANVRALEGPTLKERIHMYDHKEGIMSF